MRSTRFWHLYRQGHSINVNRGITVGMSDTSKGWLFKCECGEVWAK
jgi:hypothetical protein